MSWIIINSNNETRNSSINIALKFSSNYAVTTDKEGLQITFSKNPTLVKEKIKTSEKPAKNKSQPPLAMPDRERVPAATALKSVSTEVFENSVAVNVKTNGTIREYNAFTLANPDRYVFDLYNVKSPHRNEQKIAVQSKWIKQIRYYGHPQKLRLVIETTNLSDSTYLTVPSDTGLIIRVGAK